MRVSDMMLWSDWGHQHGASLHTTVHAASFPYNPARSSLVFWVLSIVHSTQVLCQCNLLQWQRKEWLLCSLVSFCALMVDSAQAAHSRHCLSSELGWRHLGIYAAHHSLEPAEYFVCSKCFKQWHWPRPTVGMAFLPREVYYYLYCSLIWDVLVF